MAKIKMYYNVPDVEHEGDILSDERELESMGAEIIDTATERDEDGEICDACICIRVEKTDKKRFEDYGCYSFN